MFTGHQASWSVYVRACCGSGVSGDGRQGGLRIRGFGWVVFEFKKMRFNAHDSLTGMA